MLNSISFIHDYIDNKAYNNPFFCKIQLVPVIGSIVVLYKDMLLRAAIREPKQKLRPQIANEILSLNDCSFQKGKWADIAGAIVGIAIYRFHPRLGCGLVLGSFASYCIRIFSYFSARDLEHAYTYQPLLKPVPKKDTGICSFNDIK